VSSRGIAPEESVRRRLEAEFGVARAAQILGDTTPPVRRRPVPMSVGRRPRKGPAIDDRDRTVRGPSLLDYKARNRQLGIVDAVIRITVPVARSRRHCRECQTWIEAGEQFVRAHREAGVRDYCGPCGARVAREASG
jgi:hypothetical protein